MLGMAVPDVAQDDRGQQPAAREQLQQIHTPRSIDQEFAHLTKDLELTPETAAASPASASGAP
jgi:hypothetical protein